MPPLVFDASRDDLSLGSCLASALPLLGLCLLLLAHRHLSGRWPLSSKPGRLPAAPGAAKPRAGWLSMVWRGSPPPRGGAEELLPLLHAAPDGPPGRQTTSALLFLGASQVGKSALIDALSACCPAGFLPLPRKDLRLGAAELPANVRLAIIVWAYATSADGESLEAYVRYWVRRLQRAGHGAVPLAVVVTQADVAPCPLPEMLSFARAKALHAARAVPALTVSARKGTNVAAVWEMLRGLVPPDEIDAIRKRCGGALRLHADAPRHSADRLRARCLEAAEVIQDCARALVRRHSARRLRAVVLMQRLARRGIASRRSLVARQRRWRTRRRAALGLALGLAALLLLLLLPALLPPPPPPTVHLHVAQLPSNYTPPLPPAAAPHAAPPPLLAAPPPAAPRPAASRMRHLVATFRGILRKPLRRRLGEKLAPLATPPATPPSLALSLATFTRAHRLCLLAAHLLSRDAYAPPPPPPLPPPEPAASPVERGVLHLTHALREAGGSAAHTVALVVGWIATAGARLGQLLRAPLGALGKGVLRLGPQLQRLPLVASAVHLLARGRLHAAKRGGF
ncbi:hypothetical protein AB1Y20_006942 [Prymnesium parvum]|uniref:G domain-containing protein n=1 Tax=Prymnesium parvum TaxID=97485 RepID=A0AB34IYZ6_PRYPA